MSDFSILKEMIKPSAIIEPSTSSAQRMQVRLVERQCSRSSVVINSIPASTLIIKSDDFKSPDSLFQGNHEECKRSDYILVSRNTDDCIDVIFIEMKASSNEQHSIINQLKGSECLWLYICKIGRSFWNQEHFLNRYNSRFVAICHSTINKRPSRTKREGKSHDCPERFLRISYSTTVNYCHLLGKAQKDTK